MDGTLLNGKKEMPANIFEVIDRLHQRGIVFAVASGRGHLSLLKIYDQIKDEIIFIAGNGSIIINQGEIIFTDPLKPEVVREIVETITKVSTLKPTLSGLHSVYLFEENILTDISPALFASHFPSYTIIKSIEDIPADEQILQISIFDPAGNSKENAYNKLKHLNERCHLAISEAHWLDIANIGVNKGVAIQKLQRIFEASAEETMVFGDELNDYEMMQQAYYSYAMANAIPEIKQISNFLAPSNEEQGVIRILENFLTITE